MTARRLDHKLEAIAAGRYTPDEFILADAKDADMAFGIAAPGVRPMPQAAIESPGLPHRHARPDRTRGSSTSS